MTPSGWVAAPLKRWASVRPSNVDKLSVEGEPPVRLCNYVDVYKNERITDEMDLMQATASVAQIERFTLQRQDVIVTKDSETPDDIGVPAYVPADLPGVVCGYHLTLLRPEAQRLHGGFLFWALQSSNAHDYFATSALGITRYALNTADIEQFPLVAPGHAFQERIANFLDDKTARIDALIAEKERLIESLVEYGQASITSAVTKGLNPKTKFLQANADWLGEVPAHWVQSRVRRVSTRVTDGAHISPDLTSPDYPFVSTVDIANGNINFDSCLRASAACYEYLVKTGCKPTDGDVLFSKDGTIGRTAVIQADFPDFVVASSLVIISPRPEEILPRFLNYWLNNQLLKQYVELQLVGAALRRISVEKVGQLPVLIPPLEEQAAIIEMLDSLTSRVGILLQHSIEHISRLREYRSSLISAAVTGELDLGGGTH